MNFLRREINIAFNFLLAIAISQSAGLIGSFFTARSISNWYIQLKLPSSAPPNYIFAPVWITLYTLMGIASYIVWKHFPSNLKVPFKIQRQQRKRALRVFALQLVLNTLWSILFFGLQSPFFGFLGIMTLWVVIIWNIATFYKVSKFSALLLIPYLIWVTFASYLNFAIWLLN